jgi:hypothetical protein
MPHDSADLTVRETATTWGEGCPSAYGICRRGGRSPQRSAHILGYVEVFLEVAESTDAKKRFLLNKKTPGISNDP